MDDDAEPSTRRRSRVRHAAMEEIKGAARQRLELDSTARLSLRSVARDVGLTPSAIYRYFDSHHALTDALVTDAHESLDACFRASQQGPSGDACQRWLALYGAFRTWAREHPAEFALVFGPGAVSSAPAMGVEDLLRATPQTYAPAGSGVPVDEDGVPEQAVLLHAWSSVVGFVSLELFGHLAAPDPDALFARHLDVTLRSLGLRG